MVVLLLLTAGLVETTQPARALLTETIRTALNQGDAGQLSAHFAPTLELLIDTERIRFPGVPADHAGLILRSFFQRYPPRGFRFQYQGHSERLDYSTGTYQTTGQPFTVYVLMRPQNGQYVISALHFRAK